MEEIAYAKINLALHVRERRPDGYHELETLFAFCEGGDELTLTAARSDEPELIVTGEFADALANEEDNLVLAAARTILGTAHRIRWTPLPAIFAPCFTLIKKLPVAAGLGGGSADAAAAGRLLSTAYSLFDGKELALSLAHLGADVSACIASRTVIGRGTGASLAPIAEDDVARLPILLVNPRVALKTGAVFERWKGVDQGPLPPGSARTIALAGRNDLEAPAIALCPLIADVLVALRVHQPLVARMSGSGATCFALFETDTARDHASREIAANHPDWWQLASRLR